jgi:hypothetical protein
MSAFRKFSQPKYSEYLKLLDNNIPIDPIRLVGKPEGSESGFAWTVLAKIRNNCLAFVNAVMKFRVLLNAGNLLTSCGPLNFSRKTIFCGYS